MNVAVFGVGSIGGIIASALISANKCAVTLVARGRALQALSTHGLRVQTFEGEQHHFNQIHVVNSETVHLQPRPPLDYILVCTKAHQLPTISQALSHLIGPRTVVVPCTNGLPYWFHPLQVTDPTGDLATTIPDTQLLGAVGMISGAVQPDYSCWETHWPSERNTLVIGEPNGAQHGENARAERLAGLFRGSQVAVQTTVCQPDDVQQIRDRIFDKLLINCSINSIGAVGQIDCGETCESGSSSDRLLRRLVQEAMNVGKAYSSAAAAPLHLSLDPGTISQHYQGQYGLKSSMLHDVEQWRETEKEYIVDALVELGSLYQVDTPCLETMSDLLSTYERRRRKRVVEGV